MNYDKILAGMEAAALEAGRFCRSEQERLTQADVETKGKASLVTYVDKTAEQMIVKALHRLLPEAGFVTEEGTAGSTGESLVWFVDPLDGTTNYIHGLYPCSVSIGLAAEGEMVAGVVYELGRDELFAARQGSHTTMNGRDIRVSEVSRGEDALIATGFPYIHFEQVGRYLAAMEELMRETRGLRRMGSAAADLAWVAAGRFTAFFEHALNPWDVAAGALLVQQAGGKISDFSGGPDWLFGGEMVAAGTHYFPAFLTLIRHHMRS